MCIRDRFLSMKRMEAEIVINGSPVHTPLRGAYVVYTPTGPPPTGGAPLECNDICTPEGGPILQLPCYDLFLLMVDFKK